MKITIKESMKFILWTVGLLFGVFFSVPESKIGVVSWAILVGIACLGYYQKWKNAIIKN